MRLCICLVAIILMWFNSAAQVSETDQTQAVLPYRVIPDPPEKFTAETVLIRAIDGLGFRFYWATEGLRGEDLRWKPTPDARTCEETIDHVMGLTNMLLLTIKGMPVSGSGEETSALTFMEKRRITLLALKEASDLLKTSGKTLAQTKIIFSNGTQRQEQPFWNMINGPLEDALWHTGQIVSFRRSSGNPINPKVGFFSGKTTE